MHTLLLMLLILVPAPKIDQPKQNEFVGVYTFWWGQGEQTTHFYRDGTCWSPQFGSGTWSEFEGALWFTEHGDTIQYVMMFDPLTGDGQGNRVDDNGVFGVVVPVQIRRGERLPIPRVVE